MYSSEAKILLEKIKESNKIIIHRHKRPDGDCVGSQMALKEYLQHNFSDKQIYAVGIDGYERFDYIGEIDIIKDDVYEDALVIVVDTSNKDRIEDSRYNQGKEVIKIDHHITADDEWYGDINIIYPDISSTCELLYDLFNAMRKIDNNLTLNAKVANYLFYGIYSDTGGFKFPNTSSTTYLAVSKLIEYDFDYQQTITNLETYSLKEMKLLGYAYNNIVIEDGVGYIYFNDDIQEQLEVKPADVSIIANFLGNIKELKAWVVFNQYPNFIRVNIRSRVGFDVQQVAVKFNGGGHVNAAGASIDDDSQIEDVVKELKNTIKQGG